MASKKPEGGVEVAPCPLRFPQLREVRHHIHVLAPNIDRTPDRERRGQVLDRLVKATTVKLNEPELHTHNRSSKI
eukprot:COSAG05_NODE_188_length_14697_cov_11.861145_14_plen_75_part_00